MIPTDKGDLILHSGLDYKFIFEELELAFTKEQLNRILMLWNNGEEIEDIASKERRKPMEVFLSINYMAWKGRKITRPFAYRFNY